jgi:hypothetical protein
LYQFKQLFFLKHLKIEGPRPSHHKSLLLSQQCLRAYHVISKIHIYKSEIKFRFGLINYIHIFLGKLFILALIPHIKIIGTLMQTNVTIITSSTSTVEFVRTSSSHSSTSICITQSNTLYQLQITSKDKINTKSLVFCLHNYSNTCRTHFSSDIRINQPYIIRGLLC